MTGPGNRIRTGVVLPIFQPDATKALEVARRAEAAGVDGVFCYDHLWPMGQPERPALAPFPVLGRVAATTTRLVVGTLVARVGLVPDEVLVAQFAALAAVAPGRVVAGIGAGDHLSAAENEAYGVAFDQAALRRASLRTCIRAVLAEGTTAWVGGGAEPTRRLAVEEGAALDLWDAPPDRVAATAVDGQVTWAGPAPAVAGGLAPLLAAMAGAGATWAVFPWPVDLEELGEAGAAAPMVAGQDAATRRR